MVKEESEIALQNLLSCNIPFVLFKEPGKEANCLIQNSQLKYNSKISIEKRGFYVFPFSPREEHPPIFFTPDHLFKWKDKEEQNFTYTKLDKGPLLDQNLFEIDQDSYSKNLKEYFKQFETTSIKKTILSRIKHVMLEDDIDLEGFFDALTKRYPKAFIYIMNIPEDGIWIGASPELLLSMTGDNAKTVALAGTVKKEKEHQDPKWTFKEVDEHRLVEEHIISLCAEMNLNYIKSEVRNSDTGKLFHLKSDFSVSIKSNEILSFLKRLHPTPAISGLPQEKSLDLIYKVEEHDRGYYCGFLGWVEEVASFNLYINLRCLKLIEKQCYLFAGGGITKDSNIEKEWHETQAKMATLEDLLPKNNTLPSLKEVL